MCDGVGCISERILSLNAKCSDLCMVEYQGNQHDGYVPNDIGVSDSEDYINIDYCLECGKIQGEFPIKDPDLDKC